VVSVAVLSYKAEATIQDTLNSVLNQDLGPGNIELIISDDGSADGTPAAIAAWLEKNAAHFHAARAIFNEVNGGVSRNCNVVWQACSGEWIKTIGADDLLTEDCLGAYLEYVGNRSDCDAVFAKMKWFGAIDRVTPEPSQLDFFDLTAAQQHRLLRYGSFNFAPTSFLRNSTLASVGYADESFRNIEDLPLWLKLTGHGHKLFFMDRITVHYRVAHSISKSSSRFVNMPFLLDLIAIHRQQAHLEDDSWRDRYLRMERWLGLHSTLLISKLCGNRRSWFSRSLEFLALLLRPVDLFQAVGRRWTRLRMRLARAG
jgi:glycosyltransferase involved in cell wall biosynthesis